MNYQPRLTPWQIDDSEFYEIDSQNGQIEFLLQYAILAPSSHNAQPWIFRVTPQGVQVMADFSRRLPVTDPRDRELWMSIGTAIANLRIAAAHFGFETAVLYTSTPKEPNRVALVTFRETCATDDGLRKLFPAIKQRHTNRAAFDREPVEPEALKRICDLVERFPKTLRLILPRNKGRIADLVETADEEQMRTGEYRAELADWIRGDDDSADGMPADALGFVNAFAGAAEWVLRHVDVGSMQAARDRELIDSAAALIVIAAEDDRESLVRAGEILERLLLTLTGEGLHYSFLNGPIELPTIRSQVAAIAAAERPPQLLLRIGRAGKESQPTARRPIDAVVHGNG
jgi:hypothetical protein